MTDWIDLAIERVSQVKNLPQSMVVIAGASQSGKTQLAKLMAKKEFGIYINLSLFISRHLMVINIDEDTGWTNDLKLSLLSSLDSDQPLILDNIEAVFQPTLQLNPLNWFLQLAREVPLVVVWPKMVSQGEFIYSMPNRSDYFYQRDLSIAVVTTNA